MNDKGVYDKYLNAAKDLRAKILFKIGGDRYACIYKGATLPDAIAFYQWDSPESIDQYGSDPSYPPIYRDLVTNVERLEVYEIAF